MPRSFGKSQTTNVCKKIKKIIIKNSRLKHFCIWFKTDRTFYELKYSGHSLHSFQMAPNSPLIHPPVHPSVQLAKPSTRPSFQLAIHPPIHPTVCLSVCVRPSVRPHTHQFSLVGVGPDGQDVLDPARLGRLLVVEVVDVVVLLLAVHRPEALPGHAQALPEHLHVVAEDDLGVRRHILGGKHTKGVNDLITTYRPTH